MKAALLNNRYRILETLGRGGFGETYLAEDTHMPSERKCVLKQLKPIVKQPKIPLWMKERFQREAAILEELGESHSQIPRLYAYFSEDDKFYLVQEWIEGLTLDRYWQQQGNLSSEKVKQILVQLLPVLDFVHSRHIVHRDLKPENIILRSRDSVPVLIDFGAVKEAMATQVNNSSQSMYSASIGTPGYMSSEQAAGRPVYSSDLYSLGLTAIFLLTGKTPNELDVDSRNGEIVWHQYTDGLDSNLVKVLDRATRFHPRDRFATARELLAALESTAQIPHNPTGVTLRVAPAKNNKSIKNSESIRNNTLALENNSQTPEKRGLLANMLLFVLIATGVGVSAFGAGFALISNLWRSPEQPTPQAKVETSTRKPSIFLPKAEKKEDKPLESELETEKKPEESTEAPKVSEEALEEPKLSEKETEEIEPDTEKPPKTQPPEIAIEKKPKEPLPQPEPSEINVPIITTGSSESQLVSTLGKPTSERQDWRENSRVLVYHDVVPDRVNLSYRSDATGKIRQADIALNQSVSLGAMQETLAKLLGGNAPADVKEKLRSVYNRQTNFSFFKAGNLEGKVQRDAKDRINISVWEMGYQ
jgi:serine/threonine-protein kinase